MNKTQQIICGLTMTTAFSGLTMQEKATASVYSESPVQTRPASNAVQVDGEWMYDLTAEDLEDIAAIEDAKKSGQPKQFSEYLRKHGL